MKYLVIIQPDQPGLLATVTTLLEKSAVAIEDFTGTMVGDMAVITILARPYERAFQLLSEAGFRVVSNDHLLLRLEKRAGALAQLSRRLAEAQIDIRGMHIVARGNAACIVALETVDAERARQVLAEVLVTESRPPE